MSSTEMGCDPKSQCSSTKSSGIEPILMAGELHRVGGGYSVQFVALMTRDYKSLTVDCVWEPCMPTLGENSSKIQKARYDHAKARFFQSLMGQIGLPSEVAR